MGISTNIILTAFFGGLIAKSEPAKIFSPCPSIVFRGPETISFSDAETKMLCGDPQNPPWSDIPFPQAIFQLKSFLEQRGYLSFSHRIEGKKLFIELPAPTLALQIEGIPGALKPERLRNLIGERVTPAFLNLLEKRLLTLAKEEGYPCPQVKTKCDSAGFIQVDFTLGKKLTIDSITFKTPYPKNENWRRFDAFRVGQPYLQENIDLTDQRAVKNQYGLNNYFENSCSEKGVTLIQNNFPGYPRILSFGVGADTEIGPKARATFSNLQIGQNDSNITLAALLSLREQSFNFSGNAFLFPVSLPRLEFQTSYVRKQWPGFLNHKVEISTGPAWQWDSLHRGFEFRAGATFNLEETLAPNLVDKFFSTFDASFSTLSHSLELNATQPSEGFEFFAKIKLAKQGIFSDISLLQLSVSGRHLFNYLDYKPPFIVFGFRYSFETTQTPTGIADVPLSLKYFLGGSQNLRGFPFKSLVGETGYGSLTSFFTSFETRVLDILPWGLEPLWFVDGGLLGRTDFTLETPFFISFGGGLRLATKIGVFRTTIGKGEVLGPTVRYSDLSPWNFYLSFGEEF